MRAPEAGQVPTPLRRLAGHPWLAGASVCALALALRVAFVVELWATPHFKNPGPLVDSSYYHQRAAAIANGDLLGSAPEFLSPLYSVLVGATYAVAGPSPGVVKVGQAVLGALSCALLVIIGRRLFSPGVGLLAGLILAGHDLHIYYSGLLLPTVLNTFLNLATLLALVPVSGRMSGRRCLGAGLLIGLAALAKSNALLLLPMALVAMGWRQRGAAPSRRALLAALLVLGFALPVAPIVVKDRALSGAWVPLVTSGGLNLYKGNGPGADGTHRNSPPEHEKYEIGAYLAGTVDPVEATRGSGMLVAATVEHVAAEPVAAVALLLRKLALFLNAFEPVIRDQFYFARQESAVLGLPLVTSGAIFTVGLAGAVLFWGERRRLAWLYALLGAQIAAFVMIFVLARYRLVATACLAIFAAAQLVDWAGALSQRAWRRLAASAAVALAAAAIVGLPLDGLDPRRGFADQQRFLALSAAHKGRPDEAQLRFAAISPSEWYVRGEAYGLRRRADTGIDVADRLVRAGLEEAAVAVIESVLAAIDSVPEDLRVELTRSRWRAERRLAAYAARD